MEKIRVIHFVDRLKRGGTQAVLYEWLSHIDNKKFQFDFLTFLDSDPDYVKEYEKFGANIYKISELKYSSVIKFYKEINRFFEEHQYDIAHGHSKSKNVFFLAAAEKNGVKIRISHSHSSQFQSKAFVGELLKPLIHRYATDLFACSEVASDFLYGKKMYKSGKVVIIPNGINTEKFKFDTKIREEYRNNLCISDEFIVGHVGRFMRPKNHEFIIDIFSEIHKIIPNSKLLLVGDGDMEIIKKVKEKIEKYNIKDSVIFTGLRSDVNNLLQIMDVFILPSIYEGLPMVGVEAQASGLPCFFSDVITREVKLTNSSYYLPLNNQQKWVDEICLYANKKINREEGHILVYKAGFDSEAATNIVCRYYEEKMKCVANH